MEENNSNQSVSFSEPLVQTPLSRPVNNQKGFFPIILGVLILLVVIGGGAYYLGTQKNQPSTNTQTATEQPRNEVTSIPTTQAQPTQTNVVSSPTLKSETKVGWKSYTDSSYGYTIQYPTGWVLKQEKDNEGVARIRLTSASATKAAFSSRMLPELYITVADPYSTSGAVCANQYCTETPLLWKLKSKVKI